MRALQALCTAVHNACVVTLVDRLVHKAEIVLIEGKSYRHKEAEERAAEKEKTRKANKKAKSTKERGAKDDSSLVHDSV